MRHEKIEAWGDGDGSVYVFPSPTELKKTALQAAWLMAEKNPETFFLGEADPKIVCELKMYQRSGTQRLIVATGKLRLERFDIKTGEYKFMKTLPMPSPQQIDSWLYDYKMLILKP